MNKKKSVKQKNLAPHQDVLKAFLTSKERIEDYEKSRRELREEAAREKLKDLAKELKKAREDAGLTQESLAQKLGTARSTISRIEKGKQNLTIEYIVNFTQTVGKDFKIVIS
jgi:putative transcriptional regulator